VHGLNQRESMAKNNPKVPNPVEQTYALPPPHLSSKTYHIAGILTTVFGLDELPSSTTEVACLWLLHPRLQTQACMQPFAASTISNWNERLREGRAGPGSKKGLIAVAFDLRNHGTREVDKLANEAWRAGNPRHAPDMFSQIHGNALDTSTLLDYLPAYAFPDDSVQITQNLVFGISLGGHVAWHVLLSDPRVTTGIVGIGCPDYTRLMMDRARLSKIDDWDPDNPYAFLSSKSFTKTLVKAIEKYDPAGLIMRELNGVTVDDHLHEPSDYEKEKISTVLDGTFRGKRILCLSGEVDKLVPYKCGEPYLTFLKRAVNTYYKHGGIHLEDMVFEGVGHEIAPEMVQELIRFVNVSLGAELENTGKASTEVRKGSKI
jgi:pimeloyl-ACP methyl ester carboxylesterase